MFRAGEENEDKGSRLLSFVQAIAISPQDARHMSKQYLEQSRNRYPKDSPWQHQVRAADAIIKRHAKLAAVVGATTALPGVVPGVGTAIATLGGGVTDVGLCMKMQVDMCLCLAAVFDYDIASEDARHLVFLVAVSGALQHGGTEAGVRVGSKSGVRMLNQYLKGSALATLKQSFARVGVRFTRVGLEKAIPLGIGVGLGVGFNYGFTKYIGRQAKEWFMIDQTEPEEPSGAEVPLPK